MSSPLISTDELRARLAGMTVLDVRYRVGGPPGWEEYVAGHVPGAAYVDLDRDLAAPPGEGGRHPLPDPEVFGAAMRRAGVFVDRPVVVYDDWAGQAAGRCWWLLRHHGHPDVRVLDGGWAAWRADGGDDRDRRGRRAGRRLRARRCAAAGGGGRPGRSTYRVLVDARAPERYRGETEPIDPVAGHIPGAVNVPTSANLGGRTAGSAAPTSCARRTPPRACRSTATPRWPSTAAPASPPSTT